jgi:hypothetical protein
MNKTTQKQIGEAITRAIDLLTPTKQKISSLKLAIADIETDMMAVEERLLAATKTKAKPNKNQPT